jgi:hypothetical protein
MVCLEMVFTVQRKAMVCHEMLRKATGFLGMEFTVLRNAKPSCRYCLLYLYVVWMKNSTSDRFAGEEKMELMQCPNP